MPPGFLKGVYDEGRYHESPNKILLVFGAAGDEFVFQWLYKFMLNIKTLRGR